MRYLLTTTSPSGKVTSVIPNEQVLKKELKRISYY